MNRVIFALAATLAMTAQLPFAGSANDLAQNVFQFFGRKDEWRRIPNIILSERDEMNLRPHFAIEPIEVF